MAKIQTYAELGISPDPHPTPTCGAFAWIRLVAAMYSLIFSAKLNDVDPRAWLADVLRRIADHPASRLHELLPWNWHQLVQDASATA